MSWLCPSKLMGSGRGTRVGRFGPWMVRNLPAVQETQLGFLGREDPLEKEGQPTPVFLPGKFHEQRSLVRGLQFVGSQRVGHD